MQRVILFGTEKREGEAILHGEEEIECLLSCITIEFVLNLY
jgi:hypothetical protein